MHNSQYTNMTLEKRNEDMIKHRGMTTKPEITKNKSKGVKFSVKYNARGTPIGKNSANLTSYLGVLARTMVPINCYI